MTHIWLNVAILLMFVSALGMTGARHSEDAYHWNTGPRRAPPRQNQIHERSVSLHPSGCPLPYRHAPCHAPHPGAWRYLSPSWTRRRAAGTS